MKIRAVILDGFHKGHVVAMEYMPVVRLIKPRNITVDYCCDNDMTVNDPVHSQIEYKECFRGVEWFRKLEMMKRETVKADVWYYIENHKRLSKLLSEYEKL